MVRVPAILAGILATCVPLQADDWPQWLGPQRDGVWRETGILDSFPKSGVTKVWDVPVGLGYTGPAVAKGRVFLMDRELAKGQANPKSAFAMTRVDGNERLLCLDEKTGRTLWDHSYDCAYAISYAAGPRCTPTVDDDRVYFLGAMGDLHCLGVTDGKVRWKINFIQDYGASLPVWGFAAHPLIDGNKLICLAGGSDDRLVIAFDKLTGKVLWSSLNCGGDFGYCPPMIYSFGGRRQLIIWHSKSVNGLDPETGKKIWSIPFVAKSALTTPTPRKVGEDHLFISSFYNGSMLMKVTSDGASVVWKGLGKGEFPNQSADVQSIMTTPYIDGTTVYSVCSYGQLRGVDVMTGKRLWETNKATRGRLTPVPIAAKAEPSTVQPWSERWAHAFLTPNGSRYFLFNEQGELIIAKLSRSGYEEIDRTTLLEPLNKMAGRPVVWMHPAYANKRIYVRNDERAVCYDLAKSR